MIVVYHKNNQVVKIIRDSEDLMFSSNAVGSILLRLAKLYPNDLLVWCAIELQVSLNTTAFDSIFHHHKIMTSYCTTVEGYLPEAIGYVEESPFIKINRNIAFPTWRMSSDVGGIHSSVLLQFERSLSFKGDFNYFLSSVAKVGMPEGLFCYSEPKLLLENEVVLSRKCGSSAKLFQFVKQHYRTRWAFLLFFNVLVYEKKFPLFSLLRSVLFRNRNQLHIDFTSIEIQSSRKVVALGTIDVIIPTIGRKNYLYDVLKDLAKQTHLPVHVIVVEQNPQEGTASELDYLKTESWPFEIKHIFTHQAGVCNARNVALNEVVSEWVFLADDDNRFEETLLADVMSRIRQYGVFVATTSYIQNHESKVHLKIKQWSTFGAGNSFVQKDLLENIRFNTSLEFGYGEDVDFGMQLRNLGQDVIYLPEPHILHLKAPIGGFRTKPILQWQNDLIQPKPSPTVMLSYILHKTKEQILGYKTILFLKYFKHQKIKNPYRYYSNFKKQWNSSVFWANQLKEQNEI
ncbi:glycosyltransferase family 2 protein [Flavobacterium sp. XN-5]|uniref:glycosyltransferase family 2 protein n=1 Tax=Flavobacterium sp. XN-5 TaxID=2599390 RepID=UPI0011CC299E|nr:glycosyltransferase family A protein [Flavobacterium sp. XN-5]NGY37461.1 glycosyltransferase family 2 protein [Flavobacterium sp. XN-5]